MTPAERQAKCRAIKRGEWRTIPESPVDGGPALLSLMKTAALPAPVNAPLPPTQFGAPSAALALPEGNQTSDNLPMRLPKAGSNRLRSLLVRHAAGKTLTAAERSDAQGLLDIAEFLVIQRLRHRLAA
jgi:hypothetical protein